MKRKIFPLLLSLVFVSSCVFYLPYGGDEGRVPPQNPREEGYEPGSDEYPYETDVSEFYNYLVPYGVWISHPSYGYVWTPRQVGYRWRPYTLGRWIWTDYGWTWMAEEEWGWIPYHYGRWGWEPRLGWFWVPATVWAPAWVTWRWSGLYIGWAPLPPGIEFVIGVGVRSPYDIPSHYWVFLEGRYFQHDYLDRYVLPYERNSTIVRLTVHKSDLILRNRQIINEGIDVDEVRRLTRTDVSRYELGDARSPRDSRVSGETAFIYRPAVKKNDSVKPKSYIQKDEAEKRIPEIRAQDLQGRGTSEDQERRLKEDQDREMRLLKQSQEKEDADLRQKVEDEKRLASGAAEKEKAAKEGEVKAGELKKAHDEEKTKVAERHREEEKVVKGRLKKKGED